MAVATFEAVIKDGQVRLPDGVELPESATVFVVVPNLLSSPVKDKAARRAELEAAYGDYPDTEEQAQTKAMRRRFARTLEPEIW